VALTLAWAASATDYPASSGYIDDFTGTIPEAVQQALERRVRAYGRGVAAECGADGVGFVNGRWSISRAADWFR
jgi:hypothetical protein